MQMQQFANDNRRFRHMSPYIASLEAHVKAYDCNSVDYCQFCPVWWRIHCLQNDIRRDLKVVEYMEHRCNQAQSLISFCESVVADDPKAKWQALSDTELFRKVNKK